MFFFLNEICLILYVFFCEESENGGKNCLKRLFKTKNSKNHYFFYFINKNAFQTKK